MGDRENPQWVAKICSVYSFFFLAMEYSRKAKAITAVPIPSQNRVITSNIFFTFVFSLTNDGFAYKIFLSESAI